MYFERNQKQELKKWIHKLVPSSLLDNEIIWKEPLVVYFMKLNPIVLESKKCQSNDCIVPEMDVCHDIDDDQIDAKEYDLHQLDLKELNAEAIARYLLEKYKQREMKKQYCQYLV